MPSNRNKDSTTHEERADNDAGATKAQDGADQDNLTAPWKALFFFMTRTHVPLLVAGLIVSFLAGALVPLTSFLTGRLFQGFTNYAAGTWDGQTLMREQKKYVLYLVAVGAGSWIFHSLDYMIWLAFGELQAKSARDRLFHGLIEKDIEWYDMRKNGIGALLPRLQAQIRDLQLGSAQPLGAVTAALAQCILSFVEAFYFQGKVAGVTLSLSPLLVVIMGVAGSFMQKYIRGQQEKLGEAQKYTFSAFSSIETVKCFNGQEVERNKYVLRVYDAATWYSRIAFVAGVQQGAAAFFGSAMFVLASYYGGVLIRSGDAKVSDVMTAFFASVGGFQAIQMIMPQMINLEKGRTAGATLRAIMAEVQRGGKVQKSAGWMMPPTCKGDIHVNNLTFAYPSRPDQLALDDVKLYIPGGEMSFLIGRSGSGKSTLSQLLMGFYRAELGQVTVDGIPLGNLDVNWLRSNVTLVEQQSLLFNDTVMNNIAFGKSDHHSVSRHEAMEAAEFALLQGMINDMPNGLDTMVGYKGGAMSGGQRQRMALARARLRDTPILILDESTSALDHISRALMMNAIRLWRTGKTTIIITHDISQILPDDYIQLLEHGKLVQQGYRKHLEKMKDTPFQSFLPLDQRATLSPYDARKTQASFMSYESFRTRGSSIDTLGPLNRQSFISIDPLEARLDAGEFSSNNKRQTFLPAVFESGQAVPLPLPVMGRMGRVVPSGIWNVMDAASPTSPTSATFFRQSQHFSEQYTRSNEPHTTLDIPQSTGSGNKRWSTMMQGLVDRTGKLAADARVGGQRRPVDAKLVELDVMDEAGEATYEQQRQQEAAKRIGTRAKWSLKQVIYTVWPSASTVSRIMLVLGFYGCTIHALATPMFSFVLSKLLATYSKPKGAEKEQLIYAMIILGIAAGDGLHTWLYRFQLGRSGQAWVDRFRDRAVDRILDQPKAFFDQDENSVSHLVDSLDRSGEDMRELLATFTALGYIAVMMVIVSLLWSITAQWKMTLLALSLAPYVLGVSRLYAAISGKWETASNDAAQASSAIFTETFTNIKTVRALTLEQHFRGKYIAATNHGVKVGLQRSLYTGFFFGLSDSATEFSTAAIFYIGTVLTENGADVNDCIQVFVMLIFVLTNVGVILACIPQIGNNLDSASRLLRLAFLPRDSHEHLGDTSIVTAGEIQFSNVRFAYPSRPEHTILNSINLTIPPGTSTAIVGGSGSGKSTIANLILDIWSTAQMPPPASQEASELFIASREMRTISTPSLRALIVPVLQNPTIFSATVAENITYGLPVGSTYNTFANIISAAQQAGIHDFIVSLPQGYHTVIGEGGMGLSGGQAQRVNIARALVREPHVLVLDEATSALDVESATLVRDTIQTLVHDKTRAMTVIIITHSRDMMEMAERIVVLDQGNIVEEGGFEELLKKETGALTNLLSGGEWTAERAEEGGGNGGRGRKVPKLKSMDWKAKKLARARERVTTPRPVNSRSPSVRTPATPTTRGGSPLAGRSSPLADAAPRSYFDMKSRTGSRGAE